MHVEWRYPPARSERTIEASKRKALAPYEVDGWQGRASDLGNHHRSQGNDTYLVTFDRYVDPPPATDAPKPTPENER